MGKEALDGNQFPRSGRSSSSVVRQISQVLVDVASFDLLWCSDCRIRLSEPHEKLLDICAIGNNR